MMNKTHKHSQKGCQKGTKKLTVNEKYLYVFIDRNDPIKEVSHLIKSF